MLRFATGLVATFFIAGTLVTASAQTPAPTAAPKPTKTKLTRESLKEMRVKWGQNKGKLAACRKDVKAKGLAGDDRWFYIEDCMGKS